MTRCRTLNAGKRRPSVGSTIAAQWSNYRELARIVYSTKNHSKLNRLITLNCMATDVLSYGADRSSVAATCGDASIIVDNQGA